MNETLRGLRLEEVQTASSRGGIAVRNVNNRIKLLFGEEYGIYIYSQQGAGTDVEITLPVKQVQEQIQCNEEIRYETGDTSF